MQRIKNYARRYLLVYICLLGSFLACLMMWHEAIRVIGWDDLLPLRFALNDEPRLIRLWILGNAGIAVPCFVIPILLYFYVRLRPDDLKLNRITMSFGLCFLFTAATFALKIYILYIPAYRFLMIVSGIAALAWSLLAVAFGWWVVVEARRSPGTRHLQNELRTVRAEMDRYRAEIDRHEVEDAEQTQLLKDGLACMEKVYALLPKE